jgi:pyrimidine operon attenuation protein / uracil phosphoribosyltransferase
MVSEKTIILDQNQINQKITRIAWQIYEHFHREEEIVLAGIADNGFIIAGRIETALREISPLNIRTLKITINKKNPLSSGPVTEITEEQIKDKTVIVVDDVLDSGRTLIYGAKYFLDYSVRQLKTAVLVDRSHRIFPVKADYVGLSLATTLKEQIRVELTDNGKDAAYLL